MNELIDPLEIFRIYVSLKIHFTTEKYVYSSGNPIRKTLSRKSLDNRDDHMMFYLMAEHLDSSQVEPFLLAQFVESENFWAGDVVLDKRTAFSKYKNWASRVDHIRENYLNDMRNISGLGFMWKDLLMPNASTGDHSTLFKLANTRKITIESYALLDKLMHFSVKASEQLPNDTLFERFNQKARKYSMLMHIDLHELAGMTPKLF